MDEDTLLWHSKGPISTNQSFFITKDRFVRIRYVFHFSRIVAKRSVSYCFVYTQAELMGMGTIEYATFLYDTVEVENGLNFE